MFNRLARRFGGWGFAVAMATAPSASFANAVFTDGAFNLAGYSTTAILVSDPAVSIAVSQCSSCGNPGSALQVQVSLPGPASQQGAVGLVNLGFSYDIAARGAITSIDASVDKNLLFAAQDTGGFVGTFANSFRPLIAQGGIYFLALVAGPTLSTLGETGYNSLGRTGLVATDFLQYDFATGTFGSANPDFSHGVLAFGLGQISTTGAGFNNAVITARYDNLRFAVASVPEPGAMALLALGLAMMAGIRRTRA